MTSWLKSGKQRRRLGAWLSGVSAIVLTGCGLVPNPHYQKGPRFSQEVSGHYVRVASCAHGLLEQNYRPVSKADFPDQNRTRLSRYADGTILRIFELDFIGDGPNRTRIEMDEPITSGATQPRQLMELIQTCYRA